MAFQPAVVTIVQANDTPTTAEELLDTEGIDGIVSIEEVANQSPDEIDIIPPKDYLTHMLTLRGATKEEAEAKAWGDWMSTVSGAYMLMDDSCADVFSFYNTMQQMQPHLTNTPYYFLAVSKAAAKTALAFTFVANSAPVKFVGKGIGKVAGAVKAGAGKVGSVAKAGAGKVGAAGKAIANTKFARAITWPGRKAADGVRFVGGKIASTRLFQKGSAGFIQRKANLMNGFKKAGNMSAKGVTKMKSFFGKTGKFLSHMAPPCGYNPKSGTGFKSYWRWVKKKTFVRSGKGLGPGRYIDNVKGAAHTVGIGLCVLSVALDVYGIVTSDDTQGGRHFSYPLVKHYVSAAIGAAMLIGMFTIPVVGQIAGIAALVWTAVTMIGDAIGKYNKRWKAAYKNSYKYLYDNDDDFRMFADNRDILDDELKSVALQMAEDRYGFVREQSSTPVDENDDQNGDGIGDIYARNKAVFDALQDQGVLVSYYGQKGFNLPDFGQERLQKLWKMKADYMSWKPTEAEAAKDAKRGFWGKLGKAINPMTHISWVGDKLKSREYKKTIEEYDLKKVFFNPDYVLIKKYQNWITANRYRGGIYDVVGLRMEQSPFNYIPLVGIDTAAWDLELLVQAFNADSFQVGVKEMMFFGDQIKQAREQIKDGIKETDDTLKFVKNEFVPHTKKVADALERLIDAYKTDKGREHKGLWKQCKKTFGWRWNKDWGDKTPENMITVYSADIEQALMYEPLSVSQKAADMVLMASAIKQNLDTARMMRELGEEKRAMMAAFDGEFTNPDFAEFLKEGTFLNVKGSTVMDWLSDIYPAFDEMEKYTNIYMDEVDGYTETADDSNATTRRKFLFFKEENMHPQAVLDMLNERLRKYENITAKYESVLGELDSLAAQDPAGLNSGFQLPLAENSQTGLHDGVYGDYELVCDTIALEVEDPVDLTEADFEVSPVIPE
jgi:hypothetical protein